MHSENGYVDGARAHQIAVCLYARVQQLFEAEEVRRCRHCCHENAIARDG